MSVTMQDYSLEKLKMTTEDLISVGMILKKPSRNSSEANKRTTMEENILVKHKESFSENSHSIPVYSHGYYKLQILESVPMLSQHHLASPTVRAIDSYWDANQFDVVHVPVPVGEVTDRNAFQKLGIQRCSHLPIKVPGKEFRVPNEYLNFKEVLDKIFTTEMVINPNIGSYYAYLTVDQRFVPKGNSQRIKGAHVDGIPRNRENPNSQLIDHQYVVCDCLPTRFYPQKFPQMKLCSLNQHNFFQIFDRLKDESQGLDVEPFVINLMNAYSVHSATNSKSDLIRTFLRLEFSTLQFDREGNSKNPYFANECNWEPRQCYSPQNLRLPDFLLNQK